MDTSWASWSSLAEAEALGPRKRFGRSRARAYTRRREGGGLVGSEMDLELCKRVCALVCFEKGKSLAAKRQETRALSRGVLSWEDSLMAMMSFSRVIWSCL